MGNRSTAATNDTLVRKRQRQAKATANVRNTKPKAPGVRRAAQERPDAISDSSPTGHVYASEEARRYMLEKAEQLRSRLDPALPSFVKTMRPSHVYVTFWLGLPMRFCQDHLPKEDSTVVLVDEDGVEYNTVYLPKRTGLSGGWRLFAISHRLQDGDAAVFQRTSPAKLKVYILRADDIAAEAAADILGSSSNSVETCTNRSKVAAGSGQQAAAAPQPIFDVDDDDKDESMNESHASKDHGRRCQQNHHHSGSKEEEGHRFCLQCFEFKVRARRKSEEAEAVAKENEELRTSNSCKVCMEDKLSVLLLPCKHLCLCEGCEPKLKLCPICNSAKISSVQVSMV